MWISPWSSRSFKSFVPNIDPSIVSLAYHQTFRIYLCLPKIILQDLFNMQMENSQMYNVKNNKNIDYRVLKQKRSISRKTWV